MIGRSFTKPKFVVITGLPPCRKLSLPLSVKLILWAAPLPGGSKIVSSASGVLHRPNGF